MRKFGSTGLVFGMLGGLIGAAGWADAAETSATPLRRMPVNCQAPDAPYKNYDCLDAYLGDGFFERLVNYYRLEWGHDGPPADPKAPPSRRAGWPDAPQTVAADAVHRMALWRHHQPRRDPARLRSTVP